MESQDQLAVAVLVDGEPPAGVAEDELLVLVDGPEEGDLVLGVGCQPLDDPGDSAVR